MKKYLLAAALLISVLAHAQPPGQVTFSYDGQLQYFTIITEQNVLIRVSPEGQLLEFGSEQSSIYNANYYAATLLPYPGRVEVYGDETDAALRGKVKSIGTASLNWYAQYEVPAWAGKLKSIGRVAIDYYDNFAVKSLQGKIKSIGSMMLDYYSSPSDDDAFKNKLKQLGNIPITYYSSYDDRLLKGKLKTIGTASYNWYTSFDINRSGLKSGNYRTQVNGILFIIR